MSSYTCSLCPRSVHFAKRSNQEKATPEIAPRCAGSPCRRCPERGAAKLATLRFAQTDAAPFPAPGIAGTAQSTGVKSNGNGNGNGNYKGKGKGTATTTTTTT